MATDPELDNISTHKNLKLVTVNSQRAQNSFSPLGTIVREPKNHKSRNLKTLQLGRTGGGSVNKARLMNFRRKFLGRWDGKSGPGAFPFPTTLVSPSDICIVKRYVNNFWVPAKMDFLSPSSLEMPGVPKGLELLALADHFYVQKCHYKDFPEAISIQLHSSVVNRYQVICGDSRNRIYFAVAKYPCCSGTLLGYKPFRIFILTANLELVLRFEKSFSFALFWACGGFGTHIKVTGPEGALFGTIIQRFSFFSPYFDLFDEDDQLIFTIEGPPIIPFPLIFLQCMSKFKLYRKTSKNLHREHLGTFVESSYGVGNRNMRNCLRIGFPRDIPFQQKGVLLASLFLLFFTYYELGDEIPGRGWFHQNLRPLLRMNPYYATRLNRPYGYVQGKCNPYKFILVYGILLSLVILGGYYFWEFHFVSLHDQT